MASIGESRDLSYIKQHPTHSTCTVNIVCAWQRASTDGKKSRTQTESDGRTMRAPQRCAERAQSGLRRNHSLRESESSKSRLSVAVSRPTRGMEEQGRPHMAAKVLREWTHLLSGDRGAALVQRLQDRIGGDLPEEDSGVDDVGRNFYEDLTGGQN